jgi:2-phospho-L-lactate guanylyltransferase
LQTALSVWPAERTLVVSQSSEARTIARDLGVRTLAEERRGLNAALSEAYAHAAMLGASGVLTISCDLPLLEPSDLLAMLATETPNRCVAIAVDRRGQGTNALLVTPAGLIPYCYGPGSFAAHVERANDVGAQAAVVRRVGLAFDVDTADDLEQLQCSTAEFWPQPSRKTRSSGGLL